MSTLAKRLKAMQKPDVEEVLFQVKIRGDVLKSLDEKLKALGITRKQFLLAAAVDALDT